MSIKNNFTEILIIFSIIILPSLQNSHGYKLASVSVVFRHGDRSPDEIYKNEEYTENDYYPEGLGGLINNGKKRAYDLGKFLRKTYNAFLGDLYIPSDVYARSTDFDRTQMSLLLVLAGLYPPKKQQLWNSQLNWQPIPIKIIPLNTDPFLSIFNCPAFLNEINRLITDPEFIKVYNEDSVFKEKIQNYTGIEHLGLLEYAQIYVHLQAQEAMGLEIPQWLNEYYPTGLLKVLTITTYKIFNYNNLLTKLNGGTILKIILKDSLTMNIDKERPKIFLYSGHDLNVISLLSALNLWEPSPPQYSSAVILERWEKNSEIYIKVLMFKGIPKEVKTLIIPNCTELCPLKEINRKFSDLLLDTDNIDCFRNI